MNTPGLTIFKTPTFLTQHIFHCLAQQAFTLNIFKYSNKEILCMMAQINSWEATIGSHPFSLSSPLKSGLLTVVLFSWVIMTTSKFHLIQLCPFSAANHLFYDSSPHHCKGIRVFLQSHTSACEQELSSLTVLWNHRRLPSSTKTSCKHNGSITV